VIRYIGVSEPCVDAGWAHGFNKLILEGFKFFKRPYKYYMDYDVNVCKEKIFSDVFRKHDVIFLGNAYDFLLKEIRERYPDNKMYGHCHTLLGNPLEPMKSCNAGSLKKDKEVELFDGVFYNTHYSFDYSVLHFPKLATTGHVTGFPLNLNIYDKYRDIPAKKKVVFNQRFGWEKNRAMVVHISHLLLDKGYEVVQMMGGYKDGHEALVKGYSDPAEEIGMKMQYNPVKEDYYRGLADAEFCIHTTLFESLCIGGIEALCMGVKWLGPNYLCLPEVYPAEVLYEPYSLKGIFDLMENYPKKVKYNFKWLHWQNVVYRYLKVMGEIM